MPERAPPSECAQCGTEIPRGARACPECGADERTGWREPSVYDGLDLPDTAWTADAATTRAGRPGSSRDVNGLRWYWWCVGVGLLLLLGLGAFAWWR